MRSQFLVLTAVATLALAACGGSAASPTPQPSPAGPEPTPPAAGTSDGGLGGTSWVGTKADPSSPADPALITLAFDDTALSGTGGCNRMGGDYSVADGVLTVGAMFSTEMACEEPLMAQDAWLSAFLDGATVVLHGDTLDLARDGVIVTLTDRAAGDPDRPLEATNWVLDGIVTGDAVSSVPDGVTASLVIEDGTVRVDTGCNGGGGTVTVMDTTLVFGSLAMTEKVCAGSAGDVERAMGAVLAGAVAYVITADTLTLTNADGGLVFRAAG
jgi:heat shock protein HslJ